MRVAVAGATGVLGKAAMPAIAAAGHEVKGFSRSARPGKGELMPIDLLDRDVVVRFAREWKPDVMIHLATAIPAQIKPWGVEKQFAATNALRTEGMRNLLAAASEAGGARVISQSIAFAVGPGPGLADEETPIDTGPGSLMGAAGDAVADLERLTLDSGGTVMRFGQLHGPGTIFAADGAMGK